MNVPNAVTLSESASKELLSRHGVPFGVEETVSTPSAARTWAMSHRAPFVVKANGALLAHKSERGLVRLNLGTDVDVERAGEEILEKIGPEDGEVSLTVAEMTIGRRELIVGTVRDPSLGPCLLIGTGGIFAEQIADTEIRRFPVTVEDVADMVHSLGHAAVFTGARHCAPIDIDALHRIAVALWRAMDDATIDSIDLNPVVLRDDGSLCAVDALVTMGEARSDTIGRWGQGVDLAPLFDPKGVCVVGASTHPGKFGFVVLHNLVASGYQGRIIAIGRGADSYLDAETYSDVSEMPEGAVDVAFICTPRESNEGVLAALADKGVRAVFVTTAGYRESDEDGAEAERRLVDLAITRGITVAGPNGQGLVSTPSNLCLQIVGPYPPPGPIGIASQSGNFVSSLMNMARASGVGVSRALSIGNAPHVGIPEMLEFLRRDEHTSVAICYLEDVGRADDFFRAAGAMVASKPVLVVKGGTTSQGARAASSHTGSLAGNSAAFLGTCEQVGVSACRSIDEAFDAAALLASLPIPRGERVAVLTTVGGWGVAVADCIGSSQVLRLAELDDHVMSALDSLLPARWSKGNPIDCAGGETRETVASIMELLVSSNRVDSVVFLGMGIQSNQARMMREGRFYPDHGLERIVAFHEGQDTKYATSAVELSRRFGKPIVVVTELATADRDNPGVGELRRLGVPCYSSARSAVTALEHATRWGKRHG